MRERHFTVSEIIWAHLEFDGSNHKQKPCCWNRCIIYIPSSFDGAFTDVLVSGSTDTDAAPTPSDDFQKELKLSHCLWNIVFSHFALGRFKGTSAQRGCCLFSSLRDRAVTWMFGWHGELRSQTGISGSVPEPMQGFPGQNHVCFWSKNRFLHLYRPVNNQPLVLPAFSFPLTFVPTLRSKSFYLLKSVSFSAFTLYLL